MGTRTGETIRTVRIREERDQQRDRVLDAAVALFAEKGYESTSVHDVAANAGFSVGHLYNLIGNKEALYEAVIVREGGDLSRLIDSVLTAAAGRPVRERLERLTAAILDYFDRRRAFFRFYLSQTGGFPDDESQLSPAGLRIKRHMDRRILRLMTEGVGDGSLAPLDPRDLQAAYEDALQGFIARRILGGTRRATEREAALRQILWNGIGAPAGCRGGRA